MAIRLNKVTRDLGVGNSTVVEFLRKKGFDVEENNPNAKISDDAYAMLKKAFSNDKSLKDQTEKILQARQNRKQGSTTENKKTPDVTETEIAPANKNAARPKTDTEKATKQVTIQDNMANKEESISQATEKPTILIQESDTPEAQPESKPMAQPEPTPAVTMNDTVAANPQGTTANTTLATQNDPAKNTKTANTTEKTETETPTNEVKPTTKPQMEGTTIITNKETTTGKDTTAKSISSKFVNIEPTVSAAQTDNRPQSDVAPAYVNDKPEIVKEKTQTNDDTSEETVENKHEGEKKVEEKKEQSYQPSDEIFEFDKPAPVQTPNVIGKIDLDALNQNTRPKKKTKEERRKERDEKEKIRLQQRQQMKDAIIREIRKTDEHSVKAVNNLTNSNSASNTPATISDDGDKKKRRNRINKDHERIDISNEQHNVAKGGKNNAGKAKDRFKKAQPRQEINEEDVTKQVKETLARLTNKTKSKTSKYRREKREIVQNRLLEQEELELSENKILKLTEFVTANELASMMNVPVTKVIGTCMSIGIMVSINQRLDAETINLVAEEFGFNTEYVSADVVQAINEEKDKEEDLMPRAPIVTVMGHVDHGKTSLLDYIRKANVIAGEAGGITQHIGAYNVKLDDGRHITFLDTPGHEAFTAMRARGAKVTDIVIVIVAADDDVMPQTKEAINHAMAAGVPIVFAINKIDKPSANPDKIKEALAAMNFLVEEWGGKYQSQDISAKKGIGVPDLLEKVLLEAELLELKANPNRKATGSIIESSLDKGRGYVATVLVSNGTLHMGDIVLAGTFYGKVKAMFNERNQRIKSAGPAEPVLILGLNGAPAAGDSFHVIDTDQEAREIAARREQLQREQGLRTQKRFTLDELGRRLALDDFHELNIIVKGDVDGSVEALSDSLIKLATEKIQINVIHKAVGQISESDVTLAAASNAIIVGFQVRPSNDAAKMAEHEGVDIRKYSVIYDAIEEVKSAMEGMLAPTKKEQLNSTIDVREVFHISKVGMVAGAMVKSGKVKRTDKARLIRDGIVIYTGSINALKRFKDDVKEVAVNFECGISLNNCNDIKIGDVIETYEEIEVKATL